MGYFAIVFFILLCTNQQCNSYLAVSNDTNVCSSDVVNAVITAFTVLDSRLSTKIQALEDALSEVKENLASETASRKELKEDFEALQNVHEKYKVGFQACATATRDYAPFNRIVFDHVLYNSGGGFNPSSSVYTCPMDGLYRFELHVLSVTGYAINARIMKNSFHSSYNNGYAEAYATDPDRYHAGSNSVFLECQKGDVIWVIGGNEASKLYGSHSRGYGRCLSNFSGRLVALA